MILFAWRNLITRPTRTMLAVVGLTIPILAILGLFSLTHGIRTLMGNTLAQDERADGHAHQLAGPRFQRLAGQHGRRASQDRGARIVAPEVWQICPPIEGRNLLAGRRQMLTGRAPTGSAPSAETILIEGQQLPEHLHLKSGVFEQGLLPPKKEGGDSLHGRRRQAQRADHTKIAADYPNADKTPKKVGDSILIGGKKFEVIGIYETGSLLIDTTVVMDINTARELLNVDKNSVSAFYVEPMPLVDLSDLGDRITDTVDDVQSTHHVSVQHPGRQHHGQAQPLPAVDHGDWRSWSAGSGSPTPCS